jgi:hypothetical protein
MDQFLGGRTVPNSNGVTNPSKPLVSGLEASGINVVILDYNSESDQAGSGVYGSPYSQSIGEAANLPCSAAISSWFSLENEFTVENAGLLAANATLSGIQAAGIADLQFIDSIVGSL